MLIPYQNIERLIAISIVKNVGFYRSELTIIDPKAPCVRMLTSVQILLEILNIWKKLGF